MTKKTLIGLAVLLIVLVAVYGIRRLTVHEGLTPPAALKALVVQKAPKPAPSVAFSDAGGARHSLEGLKGHYVLLNLWATWCAPCVAELPALAKLSGQVPGLTVMAVDVGRDGPKAADAFLKAHQAGALTTYVDTDIALIRAFGAYGLPMTALIDPKGNVIAKAEGPAEWDAPEAISYFKGLTGS
jgi:thiol-disulfide isomerase/thioredoxin